MGNLLQDLRYGIRMLLKNRGLAAMAVITIGLGIGVNTTIFSVVNTVLLKPAPYRDPERIVQLVHTQQNRMRTMVPPADFADWRSQSQVFKSIGASQFLDANLSGDGVPERVRGVLVNSGVFDLLGVSPILGRLPRESEDLPGADPVVLISHSLWQNRFASDPNITGRIIQINSKSYSVIGVMPEGFRFPSPYYAPGELWLLSGQNGVRWGDRKRRSLLVFARLKDGVCLDQAQAEMDVIASRLEQVYPETNKDTGVRLTAYGETSIRGSRPRLLPLFAAAGLVLLIACVNIVNLLLSRGVDRRKEIAIRSALGARRGRLIRQMLTESLMLFIFGGGLGLLTAEWGVELIVGMRSFDIPRMEEATIDGAVAAFSGLLSLFAGLAAGLLPALQYSKVNLVASLNEGGRSGRGGRGWRRFQKALIVTEMALAMVLLLGAGLLLQSSWQISNIDPGFKVDNLLSLRVTLPAKKYPEGRAQSAFYQRAIEQIAEVPGVVSACATYVPPGVGAGADSAFNVVGELTSPDSNEKRLAVVRQISPEYFRTLEVAMRQGRAFTPADTSDRPRVAIINETLARQVFTGRAAIGERLHLPDDEASEGKAESWEIVGIIADLKEEYLHKPAPPAIYVPLAQKPSNHMAFLVRTSGETEALVAAIRSRIASLDDEQPLYGIRTMEFMLASETDLQRLNLVLLGVFAIISLLLAMVGIYGVISYSVGRRFHEIGIRLALGARRRDIFKMIIGEGMLLAVMGVALGILASFGLTRFVASLLYQVSPNDPLTFAGIAILLGATAVLACYVPARRASKVDPMVALRYE